MIFQFDKVCESFAYLVFYVEKRIINEYFVFLTKIMNKIQKIFDKLTKMLYSNYKQSFMGWFVGKIKFQ